MDSYNQLKNSILADQSTSFWLKEQITTLERRDPLDALVDCEVLTHLQKTRLDVLPDTKHA